MPTMLHPKPSAMARHRAMVDLATKSAKRAAIPKPTDFSDRLRWGGSLVDPAWLKANGMDERGVASIVLARVPEPEAVIEAAAKEALNEAFNPDAIRAENGTVKYHEDSDAIVTIEIILDAVLDAFHPGEHTEDDRDALERRLSKPLRKAMRLMQSAAHEAVDAMFAKDGLDMQELAASQWHHAQGGLRIRLLRHLPERYCPAGGVRRRLPHRPRHHHRKSESGQLMPKVNKSREARLRKLLDMPGIGMSPPARKLPTKPARKRTSKDI